MEPRLVTGGLSYSALAAFIRASESILALPAETIKTPTTIFLAGQDDVVDNDRTIQVCHAAIQNCGTIVLPETKHKLEFGGSDIIAKIVAEVVNDHVRPPTLTNPPALGVPRR